MDTKHKPSAWTCRKDMQERHAARISRMDQQQRDMGMEHGQEERKCSIGIQKDVQNEHA
jgi:hypothetical protein